MTFTFCFCCMINYGYNFTVLDVSFYGTVSIVVCSIQYVAKDDWP